MASNPLEEFSVFFIKKEEPFTLDIVFKYAFMSSFMEHLLQSFEEIFDESVFKNHEVLARTSRNRKVDYFQLVKEIKSEVLVEYLRIENKNHRADIRKTFSLFTKKTRRLEYLLGKAKLFLLMYKDLSL